MSTALAALLVAAPHWLGAPPKEAPARIVALAPSLTELLFALGEDRRVVGVTRYDALAGRLPVVGGFVDPNAEAILALKPDAILCTPSPGNRGAVEALARLGAPALVLPLDTVADVLAAFEAVGRALGPAVFKRAQLAAARLERARADARAETAGRPRTKAVLLVGTEPLVAAGPKSYAGELLDDAGADNVAQGDVPFPLLSAERLVAASPDFILVAPGVGPPRLPGLRARVVELGSDAVMRPGPRLVEALGDLKSALWGAP